MKDIRELRVGCEAAQKGGMFVQRQDLAQTAQRRAPDPLKPANSTACNVSPIFPVKPEIDLFLSNGKSNSLPEKFCLPIQNKLITLTSVRAIYEHGKILKISGPETQSPPGG